MYQKNKVILNKIVLILIKRSEWFDHEICFLPQMCIPVSTFNKFNDIVSIYINKDNKGVKGMAGRDGTGHLLERRGRMTTRPAPRLKCGPRLIKRSTYIFSVKLFNFKYILKD